MTDRHDRIVGCIGESLLVLTSLRPATGGEGPSIVTGEHLITAIVTFLVGCCAMILAGPVAIVLRLETRGRVVRSWLPALLVALALSVVLTN